MNPSVSGRLMACQWLQKHGIAMVLPCVIVSWSLLLFVLMSSSPVLALPHVMFAW
jgi:hypothetical protein